MQKDARYLIRLANADSYLPVDQSALLEKVRELVTPLGAKAINLRVSHQTLEFDLFCDPQKSTEPFLTVLQSLGNALTCKRLDLPPSPLDPARVMEEARQYFNEERYWEVHEVLEGLWKIVTGSEKNYLQGLILVAAALVHLQKHEDTVAWTMLEDAARRLQQSPEQYYGFPAAKFADCLQHTLRTRKVHFPTI